MVVQGDRRRQRAGRSTTSSPRNTSRRSRRFARSPNQKIAACCRWRRPASSARWPASPSWRARRSGATGQAASRAARGARHRPRSRDALAMALVDRAGGPAPRRRGADARLRLPLARAAAALTGIACLILPGVGWRGRSRPSPSLSLASVAAWFTWWRRRTPTGGDPALNRRAQSCVGQVAVLDTPLLTGRHARVRLRDTTWMAPARNFRPAPRCGSSARAARCCWSSRRHRTPAPRLTGLARAAGRGYRHRPSHGGRCP